MDMLIVKLKLKYATSVWDHRTQKGKNIVKRVQRKAASSCLLISKPIEGVTGMLKQLGWDTLEIRRNKLVVIGKTAHKLLDKNLQNRLGQSSY